MVATALGASLVFFTRQVNQRFLSAAQGFAAGVMLAASYWSLLAPATEQAEQQGVAPWLPAAVGLLPGAAGADVLGAALALALGIGLQNFPEGAAVSLPLRGSGRSRTRSFLYGQASTLVEPVAGVLGALFVVFALPTLPYALSFAAGAMIFVVEELIPESQQGGNTDVATLALLFGFVAMMILDVAFG